MTPVTRNFIRDNSIALVYRRLEIIMAVLGSIEQIHGVGPVEPLYQILQPASVRPFPVFLIGSIILDFSSPNIRLKKIAAFSILYYSITAHRLTVLLKPLS